MHYNFIKWTNFTIRLQSTSTADIVYWWYDALYRNHHVLYAGMFRFIFMWNNFFVTKMCVVWTDDGRLMPNGFFIILLFNLERCEWQIGLNEDCFRLQKTTTKQNSNIYTSNKSMIIYVYQSYYNVSYFAYCCCNKTGYTNLLLTKVLYFIIHLNPISM